MGQIPRKAGLFHSEKPAFALGDSRLTHGQVYERGCRLVNALHSLGVSTQDRVAVLASNTPQSLEQLSGLALGGFVRVPLNEHSPTETHVSVLDQVDARVLITNQAHLDALAPWFRVGNPPRHVVVMGHEHTRHSAWGYEDLLAAASPKDPHVDIDPDDMLHITFTSGTTGPPKGVVQTHRSWLAATKEHLVLMPGLDESDRHLSVLPVTSFPLLAFALMERGAQTVVPPDTTPVGVARTLERENITCTWLYPTMVRNVAEAVHESGVDVTYLRSVLSAGAPFSEGDLRYIVNVLGDVLHLGYGQSESTPATFMGPREIRRGLDSDPSLLRSSGRPVFGSMVRIVADDGSEQPAGELGEILIDTPGTMKELWGDPCGTEARITTEGFVVTGDMGRFDDRGHLFVLGRKEDLIVRNGLYFSPSEVEDRLSSHPDVVEAAVIVVTDDPQGSWVLGVVATKEEASVSSEQLLRWCHDGPGSAPVPDRLLLQAFPLPRSPVGKLLRGEIRQRFACSSTPRSERSR